MDLGDTDLPLEQLGLPESSVDEIMQLVEHEYVNGKRWGREAAAINLGGRFSNAAISAALARLAREGYMARIEQKDPPYTHRLAEPTTTLYVTWINKR